MRLVVMVWQEFGSFLSSAVGRATAGMFLPTAQLVALDVAALCWIASKVLYGGEKAIHGW